MTSRTWTIATSRNGTPTSSLGRLHRPRDGRSGVGHHAGDPGFTAAMNMGITLANTPRLWTLTLAIHNQLISSPLVRIDRICAVDSALDPLRAEVQGRSSWDGFVSPNSAVPKVPTARSLTTLDFMVPENLVAGEGGRLLLILAGGARLGHLKMFARRAWHQARMLGFIAMPL